MQDLKRTLTPIAIKSKPLLLILSVIGMICILVLSGYISAYMHCTNLATNTAQLVYHPNYPLQEARKEYYIREVRQICMNNYIEILFDNTLLDTKIAEETSAAKQQMQLKIDDAKKPAREKKDYSSFLDTSIQLDTKQDWLNYNKSFGGHTYSFKYPANAQIEDSDDISGTIEIRLNSSNDYVSISEYPHAYPVEKYAGEDPIKWLYEKQMLYGKDTNDSYIKTAYDTYTFANGKKYYQVTMWPYNITPEVQLFFSIQNGIPIKLLDKSSLTEEQIMYILQTLSVN